MYPPLGTIAVGAATLLHVPALAAAAAATAADAATCIWGADAVATERGLEGAAAATASTTPLHKPTNCKRCQLTSILEKNHQSLFP